MIAPTFDQGNDSVLFVVAAIAMWVALGLDVLVTRLGIWYHGEAEANGLFRKILPLKAFKYMFNTAFGSFLDAGVKWALIILYVVAMNNAELATNKFAIMPFLIAAGVSAVVVRNWLLIRKKPVTATIGQVS